MCKSQLNFNLKLEIKNEKRKGKNRKEKGNRKHPRLANSPVRPIYLSPLATPTHTPFLRLSHLRVGPTCRPRPRCRTHVCITCAWGLGLSLSTTTRSHYHVGPGERAFILAVANVVESASCSTTSMGANPFRSAGREKNSCEL
jgi:hypothetical protein